MTDQVTNNGNTDTTPTNVDNNTIFGSSQPAADKAPASAPETTPPAVQTPSVTTPEELKEFVGEGKKYSSLEDALKSIPHAQAHIAKLEQENADYQAKVQKALTMEELMEQIRTQEQPKEGNTTQQVGANSEDLLAQLSAKLDEAVEQKLTMHKQLEIQKGNTQKVISAFQEAYGDKAEEVFLGLAKESGLDVGSLNSLAATSPQAVLKLAGIGSKPAPAAPTQSSINTSALITNSHLQPKQAGPVMYGATSAQVLDAWRAAKS